MPDFFSETNEYRSVESGICPHAGYLITSVSTYGLHLSHVNLCNEKMFNIMIKRVGEDGIEYIVLHVETSNYVCYGLYQRTNRLILKAYYEKFV